MIWIKMVITLLRLTGKNLFTPWNSSLLRWRMETYGITNSQGELVRASELSRAQFIRFIVRNRKEFLRFLRWASEI